MNFYSGSRRSSMASTSTSTAANPVKDDFPEALTYRFNDNSAWVPAAKSHDASFFSLFGLLQLYVANLGLTFFFPFLFWISGLCTGGHRSCETRISRITERPPRMHHVPHDGQVEHSLHHAGGMATRRAAASPISRRGRENSGYGRVRRRLGTSGVPLYGRCCHRPARKGGAIRAESTTPTERCSGW